MFVCSFQVYLRTIIHKLWSIHQNAISPIWESSSGSSLHRHFICRPVSVDLALIIVDPVYYPFQFPVIQLRYIHPFGKKAGVIGYHTHYCYAPSCYMGGTNRPPISSMLPRFAIQGLAAITPTQF